jgi:hypothetical protein
MRKKRAWPGIKRKGHPHETENHHHGIRAGWEKKLSVIRDNVRSMSGWTRELLGAPEEVKT